MIVGVGLLAVELVGSMAAPRVGTPERTTLFLDFGGGPVATGEGAGAATCVTGEFVYPIFLGSEQAAELALAEARRLLAPYGVHVVGQRPPPTLRFTHVRVGGAPQDLGLDPQLNGLSCDVDCDDRTTGDNVFMFSDKWIDRVAGPGVDQADAAVQVGRIAVHEAAHAWGLEHTGGSESIMARFPSAIEPTFVQGCQALDLDGDSECPETRARYCGPGEQDAHAELLALFGDGTPDTTAPRATIVWPPDGFVVEPGDTIVVEVAIEDDHRGFGWRLEVPQLEWEHVATDPARTEVALVVPEGEWTLHLEAIDHDRNIGEAEVRFEARAPTEGPSPQPGPQAECACRDAATIGHGAWAWLLLLLGSWRRRARAIVDGP